MNAYIQTLKDNNIFQSMSRKGTCLYNSPMENFFNILKQEVYYGKIYQSQNELREAIENYIYYYNHHRIKEIFYSNNYLFFSYMHQSSQKTA
ncbi:hypothetical protein D3Z35_16150 [Enterococcus faecalis]|nr:hypothetical protein A4V06_14890 [Enterococcus faecalis]ASU26684.1 hypothetical protein ADH73_11820 [Enterococcus faecalis]NBH39967.1 hypothetical protein [Enterococcus faecalis]QQR11263.1 IS3 family transposase [Enterococcus faecalis]